MHMYTCVYVCMYTNINMHIYTYINIYTYAHTYTNTYNLYIYMHMYFGHNYICIYIFIGINWGMTSYFKSSVLVPFLSLYNRICQIPFDHDRDQLQLETVKNNTCQDWKKKGICIQGSYWISQICFCVTNRDRFFGFMQPWVQTWTGCVSLGKNDKSEATSINLWHLSKVFELAV